jgi:hypothetical protein
MEKITIRAFRAPDDQDMCQRYVEEHSRVLTDLGVSQIVKYDESWRHDRDTIVFVALHPELGLVSGIRLQRAKVNHPMPMEKALSKIEPSVSETLAPWMLSGNAELGALWNAHRYAGNGLPHLLIAAAVATANQADLEAVVCLVAEYIAPYCSATGFRNIENLGNKGEFVYPLPNIRSYAMMVSDVRSLSGAEPGERRRALSLRMRPEQIRIEQPKRTILEVSYELLLDKAEQRYSDIASDYRRYAA